MNNLPLTDVRVLEIGSWVAAPAAARILKEWGATIIKVEPLNGDPLRGMANPARVADVNPPFELCNAGKRSVAIDLKSEVGHQLVIRLARACDIVLTNLPPAAARRLRLDYDSIRSQSPRVIYCAVTGYGMEGDRADRPAFDGAAWWAASGQASLFSQSGQPPAPPRAAVGDHTTSLSAVAGILLALLMRGQTDQGSFVQTSLIANGAFTLSWDYSNLEWVGVVSPNPNRKSASNPLNNYYLCRDGKWLALVNLSSDQIWPRLCEQLGIRELRNDERFNSARARARNAEALVAELDRVFAGLESEEASALLELAGAVWAPVTSPGEAFVDGEFVRTVTALADFGPAPRRIVRVPVEIDGMLPQVGGPVPEIGQHTEEELVSHGVTWDQILEAKEAGAIA